MRCGGCRRGDVGIRVIGAGRVLQSRHSPNLRYKMSVFPNRLMSNWFMRSATVFRRRLRYRYKMSCARNSMRWWDSRR